MGEEETLKDFLRFALENYRSERMGLIFWDHGGGSTGGVCFDETRQYDSLSLFEMEGALTDAWFLMDRPFEFIGFDACLMSTLECANLLVPHARYMIASQEIEPGSGWNFRRFLAALDAEPGMSAEELGQEIVDSYFAGNSGVNYSDIITLSVIDLSRIDPLLQSFHKSARLFYEKVEPDNSALPSLLSGIYAAENYGFNNRVEGYNNMVDLASLLQNLSRIENEAELREACLETEAKLAEAVVYLRNGVKKERSGGLSIYFPLKIMSQRELPTFEQVAVSPYYLAFIDRFVRQQSALEK